MAGALGGRKSLGYGRRIAFRYPCLFFVSTRRTPRIAGRNGSLSVSLSFLRIHTAHSSGCRQKRQPFGILVFSSYPRWSRHFRCCLRQTGNGRERRSASSLARVSGETRRRRSLRRRQLFRQRADVTGARRGRPDYRIKSGFCLLLGAPVQK